MVIAPGQYAYRDHVIAVDGNHVDIFDEVGQQLNFSPVPIRAARNYIDRHVSRAVASIISRAAIFAQGS
jgi:hypothetical protein